VSGLLDRPNSEEAIGSERSALLNLWGGGSLTPAVHMYTYPIARLTKVVYPRENCIAPAMQTLVGGG
jgi:hypothetical protein